MRDVHKAYAAPVLSGVDLDVRAGEIHALVGANGAGKSTLTRIVTGLLSPDRATMRLGGVPYHPASRRQAEDLGVRLVPQEAPAITTLSVAEQMFLGRLPHRGGIVARRRLHEQASSALVRLGLGHIDPTSPVAALGVGQRQLLAIAAALAGECRVLILDEPTAALGHADAERLLHHLRDLRSAGMAILYISHRLDEILAIGDRVTVLRDGRVVEARAVADTTRDRLVAAMVPPAVPAAPSVPAGSVAATVARDRPPDTSEHERRVALRVSRLSHGTAVRDVSLSVDAGEIVGLYGLVGAGRTELLRAIYGADPHDAGDVRRADGPPLSIRSPMDAVRAGIGLIPEDRAAHALLGSLPVRSNVLLSSLGRLARWRWFVDTGRETSAATTALAPLDVRCRSIEQPVGELSGGNQQKVVVARWLLRDSPVLLVDEPTRGVDVGARAAIHAELRALAGAGRALLVASSELDELTTLCDRIVVMARGRVTGTFTRGAWRDVDLQAAAFAPQDGDVLAAAR
ncbi:MAG TPA: sugar ABC transporter ATP-binding protein [Luteitalea sp.]|nr:sugar ABC transporter ATP-binding protein [Luteitalea sp.]